MSHKPKRSVLLNIEWIKEDVTYNSVTKLPTIILLRRVYHSIAKVEE